MIEREAVLRELNLYPLWVRRNAPAISVNEVGRVLTRHDYPETDEAVSLKADLQPPLSPSPSDEITSHSTKHDKTVQVAGYPANGRGEPPDWTELKRQVRDCTACKLRAGCTQTVFGVGDEKAEWLFVGEGPGADEDAQGEPFVGQAGKLLDNMLAAIKLRRGRNVYIANIVKCRPPGNRTPEADEVAACVPYLQQQIALIEPKLIIALGKTAATSLLGRDAALGSLRGAVHDYRGIPLIVTYHPAYLLRSPSEKAKAWQDLCFAVQQMANR